MADGAIQLRFTQLTVTFMFVGGAGGGVPLVL
jgi:hypothetical protein